MNSTRRTPFGVFFSLVSLLSLLARATAAETYTENPGTNGDGNITVGPEYPTAPDLTDLGHPKGKFFEFKMRLADSKIFRCGD